MSESLDCAIDNLNFWDLNTEIKRTMRRSARDVVQIGYMLRRMIDDSMWESI